MTDRVSDLLYPVMQFDLVLGDEVQVLDELGQSVEKYCVFMMSGVTDGDSPVIEVACQASGRTLEIVRFGKRVGRLEPKPWDIIINEPSFLALFPLLVAALFRLVQSVLFYAFWGESTSGKAET